jgi:hypothetical protein
VSLAEGLAEARRNARVSVEKDDLRLSASDEVTLDPRSRSPARIQPAAGPASSPTSNESARTQRCITPSQGSTKPQNRVIRVLARALTS